LPETLIVMVRLADHYDNIRASSLSAATGHAQASHKCSISTVDVAVKRVQCHAHEGGASFAVCRGCKTVATRGGVSRAPEVHFING